ncbi:MAG: GNAT family N-acetyltransferase [Hungatella sp.]|jgi:GNAT superfamily N-acetyltransferase|nr:GNAT family N-acetyltransferase [Hungatella sp.]
MIYTAFHKVFDRNEQINLVFEGRGNKLETITLKKLCDYPEFLEEAAFWFSQKWGIPVEAYRESMKQSISQKAGIIENDFHDRKDLSPNLCALYVKENYRGQGIAKYILDFSRKDLSNMGFEKIYLITDHTEFYEKCGWDFLTMVNGDDGSSERMYAASTLI